MDNARKHIPDYNDTRLKVLKLAGDNFNDVLTQILNTRKHEHVKKGMRSDDSGPAPLWGTNPI